MWQLQETPRWELHDVFKSSSCCSDTIMPYSEGNCVPISGTVDDGTVCLCSNVTLGCCEELTLDPLDFYRNHTPYPFGIDPVSCRSVSLSQSLSLCLSVCLYLCPTVCLFPRLPQSVPLSVSVSVPLSVSMSFSVSVPLSACLHVCLSQSLSHCLPVCLSLCPTVSLSVSVSVCLHVCLHQSRSVSHLSVNIVIGACAFFACVLCSAC